MNKADFIPWCHDFSNASEPSCCPLIMGILNVTPDSFSDGGRYVRPEDAMHQFEQMVSEGADIIDLGGESTRPGAVPISCAEELDRVIPIIERIRDQSDITISIDTSKPEVMHAAVEAGATFINDIYALQAPNALETIRQLNVPVCLMHMQRTPSLMQQAPCYKKGIVLEVDEFFHERINACISAGIQKQHLILDPGFGFGKENRHNLILTQQLSVFKSHGLPLLLGASRKATVGFILNKETTNRMHGSIGLAVYAALQGVNIIRTHDVAATKDAIRMVSAVVTASIDEGEN